MKIAVVYDTDTYEQKKNMVTAVKNALLKKYDATELAFDENFMYEIKKYDMVFNLSSSGGRESRQMHVPAILDIMGILHTGPGSYTHALCLNKTVTKIILRQNGIPTPLEIKQQDVFAHRWEEGTCFIVKPEREGSAKGISDKSVVYDAQSMKKQVEYINHTFKQPALIEEFIMGRELSIGIVGNDESMEVLPILEIDFSGLPQEIEHFYSHRVKEEYGHLTSYKCPASLDNKTERVIKDYAAKIFNVLELKDYCRMDVRLNEKNEPFFIDVNSMPMLMLDYSDIIKMAKAAGLEYDDLILKIAQSALSRK